MEPTWRPDPDVVATSTIARFAEFVGRPIDYDDLWAWSVEKLDEFWRAVWEFFEVQADGDTGTVLAEPVMPGASWFPGTTLNYAEHALRHGADDVVAVTAINEDGVIVTTTWGELRAQVGALAGWLRAAGVTSGDRVVGYLPNTTPALVAFLATASIGAVWSACAQDYSGAGAANRLAQLEPVVLFAADGYLWNGRAFDRRAEVEALQAALTTVRVTVQISNLGLPTTAPNVAWRDAIGTPAPLRFERVGFDAPLWVLFSSGTTGLPKGIVHGHGGVLLEHLKMLGLQVDVRPERPFFWYTSTNWIMWNILIGGLLVGAPVLLYDGSPTHPGPGRLWQLIADHRVAAAGVSPGYLAASIAADLHPGRERDLSALQILGVTGAPLSAPAYGWVRDAVGERVQVASTSGGTDVVSGFAGSAANTPVWAGEISAPYLGVALEAWSEDGKRLVDEVGELVVTKPMPSMPLYFWNDPTGERYREAYFSTYPGVWRHGDWMVQTAHGSLIVTGRSDSTLNRHGVRLGSADIYTAVDAVPEIAESLVIGAELGDGGYWLALFVIPTAGVTLDDGLIASIKKTIATSASPRHVPDDVIAVSALPHTRTGKKLEVPVKRIIQGQPLERVASPDAVDNYEALAQFTRYVGGRRD